MMHKVGFVGLGTMGLPMATHLVAAGFEVRGYDVAAAALGAPSRWPGERAPTRRPRRRPAPMRWC